MHPSRKTLGCTFLDFTTCHHLVRTVPAMLASQKHLPRSIIDPSGAPCLTHQKMMIHRVSTLMATGSRLLIALPEQGLPQLQYPSLALFQGLISTRSTVPKPLKACGVTHNRVP